MRLVALNEQENKDNLRWASLPILCCQAAQGKPENALPVASAWFLLYMAAGIMDSVEDGDPPAKWWKEAGPSLALSVATGLYFSANLALNRLEEAGNTSATAQQVRREILSSFFEMGAGQHLDINQPAPNLAQYWQVARGKSGAFFELASWAGARLATRRQSKLLGYRQFGMNVGMIIQVLDDLHDYLRLEQSGGDPAGLDMKRSLPSIYIHEMAPQSVIDCFDGLVNSQISSTKAELIFGLVDQSGGSKYIKTELDRLYLAAANGLDQAGACQPQKDQLIELLNSLHSG
jgi:geranylgeranyl pyrophosphate synthase